MPSWDRFCSRSTLSAPVSPEPEIARGLDPRTKLAATALAGIVIMTPGGLRFVVPALLLGVGLALWRGAWLSGIVLAGSAALLWAFGWMLPGLWPGTVSAVVSSVCIYTIRFLAILGIGLHLFTTTSPTRLSAGLRAARTPRALSVTLAVMLRFFPVVAAEAVAVVDAMRLRGLAGVSGFLRHPILSMERLTVPLIASSLRATEDLSASAILRGLGSRRRPTAMVPPRLGWADLGFAGIVAVLAAGALLLPNPLA